MGVLKRLILLGAVVGVLAGCSTSQEPIVTSATLSGVTYQVEVADTPQERSRGLMNREDVESRQGMLFLYQESGARTFWMKDTPLPLTAVWINSGKVVGSTDMIPCVVEQEPCSRYSSPGPANAVLEVRTDSVPSGGFPVGSPVEFR